LNAVCLQDGVGQGHVTSSTAWPWAVASFAVYVPAGAGGAVGAAEGAAEGSAGAEDVGAGVSVIVGGAGCAEAHAGRSERARSHGRGEIIPSG
jgi:hypothetical protein